MMQERAMRKRPTKPASTEAVEEIVIDPEADADLLDDIDQLLDEIDAVLEDQMVLTTYRQRSGQ